MCPCPITTRSLFELPVAHSKYVAVRAVMMELSWQLSGMTRSTRLEMQETRVRTLPGTEAAVT